MGFVREVFHTDRFEVDSPFTPDEIVERARQRGARGRFAPFGDQELRGPATRSRLSISIDARWGDLTPYIPVLVVRMVESGGTTSLRCSIRPLLAVTVFFTVWLTLAVAIAVAGLVSIVVSGSLAGLLALLFPAFGLWTLRDVRRTTPGDRERLRTTIEEIAGAAGT